MKNIIYGFAILGIVSASLACSNNKEMTQSIQSVEPVEVPEDLEIMIGRGGGFAGRSSGFTIRADGAVLQWEGKFPEENTRKEGTLSSEHLAQLWQEIDQAGFFDHEQQEAGNLTQFISVKANGATHRVSWARILGDDSEPNTIQLLYDMCRRTALDALDP